MKFYRSEWKFETNEYVKIQMGASVVMSADKEGTGDKFRYLAYLVASVVMLIALGEPRVRQTTSASLSVQWSSHTVPQSLL